MGARSLRVCWQANASEQNNTTMLRAAQALAARSRATKRPITKTRARLHATKTLRPRNSDHNFQDFGPRLVLWTRAIVDISKVTSIRSAGPFWARYASRKWHQGNGYASKKCHGPGFGWKGHVWSARSPHYSFHASHVYPLTSIASALVMADARHPQPHNTALSQCRGASGCVSIRDIRTLPFG